jgi:ribokinase
VDLDARLTVLGSLNMDISVTVSTLPGPGATVLGGPAAFAPGGKGANQAVAAARLGTGSGIRVRMVGCVGDDDMGRALRAALAAEGIDDRAVRSVPGAPTGIAMITVDERGENTITVAPGANHGVGADELAAVGEPAPPSGIPPAGPGPTNVLVISAEIPAPAILTALAATSGLTVLNLAPAPPAEEAARILQAHPNWLVVNESEAADVLGRPVSGLAEAARAAAGLVAAGARNAVVTAGAAGAAYHGTKGSGKRQPSRGTVPAFPVRAVDTVGAGDTFVGALAVALAAGIPPGEAVTAAAAAGATAATRPGTQAGMPRPADIRAATGYEWPLANCPTTSATR